MSGAAQRVDMLCSVPRLLLALWALPALALLLCAADSLLRPELETRVDAGLMQALQLSSVAIVPSGRSGRAIEIEQPALDLRQLPGLPPGPSH